MLARRIMPCLDVADGRVVTGLHGEAVHDAGDPVEQATRYDREGADELVLLDRTASYRDHSLTLTTVERVAEAIFIPFTVGGGIGSVEDAGAALRAGADKVAVNTGAIRDPDLISRLADAHGSQCIVAAVGVRREGDHWMVVSTGERAPTGLEALTWLATLEDRGAGEILLTSLDRDGSRSGYDLDLTEAAARTVGIPVIASGGAGSLAHLADAFEAGAQGVLAASFFHGAGTTIADARAFLIRRGILVRP